MWAGRIAAIRACASQWSVTHVSILGFPNCLVSQELQSSMIERRAKDKIKMNGLCLAVPEADSIARHLQVLGERNERSDS